MERVTVVLYQQKLLGKIPDEDLSLIASLHPDFLCLPEHFFVTPSVQSFREVALSWEVHLSTLREISVALSCSLIGGTLIQALGERLHNVSYLLDKGEVIGRVMKLSPTSREQEGGISPGTEIPLFEVRGIKVGILICADVLSPENFAELGRRGSQLIFVPTVSPFRPGETVEEKFSRDEEIFVQGARKSNSYVVKACAVGSIFGRKVQGRSLVASPQGILLRVPPEKEQESQILSITLSLEELKRQKLSPGPGQAPSS